MVGIEEAQPLLSKKQDDRHSPQSEYSASSKSTARASTPKFGHVDWWILNLICLFTITLLSIWQVSTKAAMTVNLESSPGEVIPMPFTYIGRAVLFGC
jgi:hypothetical protein